MINYQSSAIDKQPWKYYVEHEGKSILLFTCLNMEKIEKVGWEEMKCVNTQISF